MAVQGKASDYSGVASGFAVFAAIVMILLGFFQAIAGAVALFNRDFYVAGEKWVFQFSTTTWGWIHLILGIVVLLAGFGIYRGAVWARTVGVLLAGIVAVVSFAWLPWYPVWGVLLITLSVIVIWALTAHGRDITRKGEDYIPREG